MGFRLNTLGTNHENCTLLFHFFELCESNDSANISLIDETSRQSLANCLMDNRFESPALENEAGVLVCEQICEMCRVCPQNVGATGLKGTVDTSGKN